MIDRVGTDFLVCFCEGKPGNSHNNLRYRRYAADSEGSPNLNITGWEIKGLFPTYCLAAVAPASILNVVACSCKSQTSCAAIPLDSHVLYMYRKYEGDSEYENKNKLRKEEYDEADDE